MVLAATGGGGGGGGEGRGVAVAVVVAAVATEVTARWQQQPPFIKYLQCSEYWP